MDSEMRVIAMVFAKQSVWVSPTKSEKL